MVKRWAVERWIVKRWVVALLLMASMLAIKAASGQTKEVVWSADEKPLHDQIHGLRDLPDDVRARTTKDLAINIRQLPTTENKLRLAVGLASLSTEGDFGHDTLQEVATTLAETLRAHPLPWPEQTNSVSAGEKSTSVSKNARATREPAGPYIDLASLVH